MFSTGQIYFAIFFVTAFTAAMIWSYRKDLQRHKIHYKNTAIKVFLGGILITIAFILIRIVLK
ncbi:heme/copper-type cytochrome/quinol oxidase subunit 2 [Wenyingzhuangia heitensis]|uniref:Heme/copper-type cytochrome/quinol oxidase subunit 2 n=1 Tax=Wenyingzhuangia heitensis TaxID=1487859 RepID=A0ABX0UA94_9FLAO|nr:hypothetical protein [Wenyingzhuangia heitensis]NIJ45735.1 heme/copper-type cytochrome/quinol oxidase subunit 2 [Wenyingzhuangia heitensis]